MNPVVIDLGPVEIRSFAAWIMGGAALAMVVLAVCAVRYDPARLARWLDVGLAAVIGGVIGARLLYGAEQWATYGDFPDAITDLGAGGLAWHGAVGGGLLAALIAGRLRGLRGTEWRAWTDAAALAWPLGVAVGWLACRRNGCACGAEVRTLADWPGWMVEELPDIYGSIAPRLDLALGGLALAGLLLALAILFTWRGWLAGLRLWPILALTGLGMALLGFFRADPAGRLLDRRADQVYDLGLLLACTLIGCGLWLADRQSQRRSTPPTPGEIIHVEKFKV